MISAVSRARTSGELTMTSQPLVAQQVGGLVRLRPPGVVQRDVARPLQAVVAVPVGLAVADEGEHVSEPTGALEA